jgi:hypothetical protein
MRRVILTLRESFPDLEVSVEGQEAEGGDTVRTRLHFSVTDMGGVLWFPATRRHADFRVNFERVPLPQRRTSRARREERYRGAAAATGSVYLEQNREVSIMFQSLRPAPNSMCPDSILVPSADRQTSLGLERSNNRLLCHCTLIETCSQTPE